MNYSIVSNRVIIYKGDTDERVTLLTDDAVNIKIVRDLNQQVYSSFDILDEDNQIKNGDLIYFRNYPVKNFKIIGKVAKTNYNIDTKIKNISFSFNGELHQNPKYTGLKVVNYSTTESNQQPFFVIQENYPFYLYFDDIANQMDTITRAILKKGNGAEYVDDEDKIRVIYNTEEKMYSLRFDNPYLRNLNIEYDDDFYTHVAIYEGEAGNRTDRYLAYNNVTGDYTIETQPYKDNVVKPIIHKYIEIEDRNDTFNTVLTVNKDNEFITGEDIDNGDYYFVNNTNVVVDVIVGVDNIPVQPGDNELITLYNGNVISVDNGSIDISTKEIDTAFNEKLEKAEEDLLTQKFGLTITFEYDLNLTSVEAIRFRDYDFMGRRIKFYLNRKLYAKNYIVTYLSKYEINNGIIKVTLGNVRSNLTQKINKIQRIRRR